MFATPVESEHARHNNLLLILVWNPQGSCSGERAKFTQKLPTSEMLVSTVESVSDQVTKSLVVDGSIRTNPCDPENIGNIIGSGGKNINSVIQKIQKVCKITGLVISHHISTMKNL